VPLSQLCETYGLSDNGLRKVCKRLNVPVDAGSGSGLPAGAVSGRNDWKRGGYGGPCPPLGRHRYFHKLYALDRTLSLTAQATKAEVEAAMRGHVLATAELVGTYEKKRR